MTTQTQILDAVDSLTTRGKARLMPKLRRRLEDYYDLQAVKRAQSKGVYHAYEIGKTFTDKSPHHGG